MKDPNPHSSSSSQVINPVWIIQKKRDGHELSPEEIQGFISGMLNGDIADYQVSALLMAIYMNGMSSNETLVLTQAMAKSGESYDLASIPGIKVDKHSTGGVGDKTSLIVAPLAAACGLKVPMMAGRGLGASGGTLDKLEAISGFKVKLSKEQFIEVIQKAGCAIIGQSDSIAPADKKLYAIRDVTGTVESTPLIVSSILSKKLAEGTNALLIDVKVGNGAFMKTQKDAQKLAKTLIAVAKKSGLKCRAILTDMNQPLGYTIGNSLEVMESINVLRNEKNPDHCCCNSSDLKELSIQLCSHMLEMGKVAKNLAEGRRLAHDKLSDGSAWKVFQEFIGLQGGSMEQLLNAKTALPLAPQKIEWKAKTKGFITQINTELMGRILIRLGGGPRSGS